MVKAHSNYTLMSLTGTTGASSALAYARTERSTVEVAYVAGSTGVTTIKVQGSGDSSSPTSWTNLDSVSKTATETYSVEINGAYNFIRTICTAIATTGSTVAATIITQGAGV